MTELGYSPINQRSLQRCTKLKINELPIESFERDPSFNEDPSSPIKCYIRPHDSLVGKEGNHPAGNRILKLTEDKEHFLVFSVQKENGDPDSLISKIYCKLINAAMWRYTRLPITAQKVNARGAITFGELQSAFRHDPEDTRFKNALPGEEIEGLEKCKPIAYDKDEESVRAQNERISKSVKENHNQMTTETKAGKNADSKK